MKASDDAKGCARKIIEMLYKQSCVGCKYDNDCGGEICKRDRKAMSKIIQETINQAYQDGYSEGYDDAPNPVEDEDI